MLASVVLQAVAEAAASDAAPFLAPVRLAAGGEVIDHGPQWGHCGPTLADVDGDGQLDLLVGDFSGRFRLYRNAGTSAAPRYEKSTLLRAGKGEAKVPIY